MKKLVDILIIWSFLILLASSTEAGNFVSGSTGADGSFNPPTQVPAGTTINGSVVTVPLPANGIFNFTTFTIPSGTTVKFQKNAANTPVYIFATGDVNIAGTINISGENGMDGNTGNIGPVPGGKGGPGGFDGGWGGEPPSTGIAAKVPGNGLGPGGGKGGDYNYNCTLYFSGIEYFPGLGGGFGTKGEGYYCSWSGGASISGGNPYGSPALLPLIGGSGGGGALAGSSLNSYGAGGGGGGSGGAIRLVSNRISISDNGSVQAIIGVGLPLFYQGQWYNHSNGGSGRIRVEGYTVIGSNISPTPSITTPGLVFLPQIPALLITKIAGNSVPASASGSYTTPDVTLPSTITNPISIEIIGSNIPVGTSVKITTIPQHGTSTSTTTTLAGTDANSTATASLSISTTEPSIINAETTFTVQTAMFYDGEKIEKVRVASNIGKASEVTYITEAGKEIPAEKLFAKVVR